MPADKATILRLRRDLEAVQAGRATDEQRARKEAAERDRRAREEAQRRDQEWAQRVQEAER
jgi:predicted aminopeptidase